MSANRTGSPGENSPEKDAVEDAEVIALLRTPGLSIKYLDPGTKERIRGFIQRAHVERGISLGDIAKLIGNKTSGYTSWLTRQVGIQPREFEEARLASIHKKVRKHERKPFDGSNQDRAYLLGMRHGDLSAIRPFGDAVRVSTSTTHPAMAELFRKLFEPYGHVYQHSRYKKDTCSYEWNIQVILDDSFAFMLESRESGCRSVSQSPEELLGYLAGFLDAEGHIGLTRDKKNTSLMVTYFNTDLALLNFVADSCRSLGYTPLGPYLDKKKDTKTSRYQIERKRNYYKVVLDRFAECQSFLSRLPVRHPERIEKKNLALSLTYREPWETARARVVNLRNSFRTRRDKFVEEAAFDYLSKHPVPDAGAERRSPANVFR